MTATARYALALLAAASFFNYLDRMVLAVLVEPIKHDLALNDLQMGLVSGFAFALLYATAGLPLARLADTGSRRRLVAVCMALWSAMTAATGLARNFTELFVARMAVGIGEAGCVPASHSLIGDLVSPARRPLAISLFQAGGLLGMTAGLALAGLIAQHWGWRAALGVVGAAGLPLALLMVLTLPEPERRVANDGDAETLRRAVFALARRPALVNLIAGLSIGSFATYGIAQWMPAYYVRIHGLSLATIGLWGGVAGGGGGIAGTLAGGALAGRLVARDVRWELWMPALCFAAAAPVFVVAFLAASPVIAFAAQFAATFLAAAGGGVALAAIQSFAEPQRRATAIATMIMLSSLIGLGLGPVGVGAASDWLSRSHGPSGLRLALAGSTAMLVWAAAHFLLAARTARRDRPGENHGDEIR